MYGNPNVTKLSKSNSRVYVKAQILHIIYRRVQKVKAANSRVQKYRAAYGRVQKVKSAKSKTVDGTLSCYYKVQSQKYSINNIDKLIP